MTALCGISNGIERSKPTSQNIHKRLVRAEVSRSLPAPAVTETSSRGNRNPVPKPWQGRVHRSLHVKTAQPFTLQPLRLVGREHGVVAVSVGREDGVVAPQHEPIVHPAVTA